MTPVDWGQAWRIVGGGLLAVFLIMSLLATITHFMGKVFQGADRRRKAKAEASQAAPTGETGQ